VRDAHAFAAGHRSRALNVPVSGSTFGTRAAFILPERPIVIEARDEAEADDAARGLWAVGLFRLAGWRVGGGTEKLEPVTVDELERRLAAGEIELLDVREAEERDTGFIPGSTHLPYRTARQAAENGLCGERPIVTICESGARAAIAASVLQAAGLDARPVLDGGIPTWSARGGETATFRRCGS
jgi:hydroxyacylglutathione hydrolase